MRTRTGIASAALFSVGVAHADHAGIEGATIEFYLEVRTESMFIGPGRFKVLDQVTLQLGETEVVGGTYEDASAFELSSSVETDCNQRIVRFSMHPVEGRVFPNGVPDDIAYYQSASLFVSFEAGMFVYASDPERSGPATVRRTRFVLSDEGTAALELTDLRLPDPGGFLAGIDRHLPASWLGPGSPFRVTLDETWVGLECEIVYPIDPGVALCPTDLDVSGSTGPEDLLTLLSNFGRPGKWPKSAGDTDGDLDVDLNDLLAVLSAFGEDCP